MSATSQFQGNFQSANKDKVEWLVSHLCRPSQHPISKKSVHENSYCLVMLFRDTDIRCDLWNSEKSDEGNSPESVSPRTNITF